MPDIVMDDAILRPLALSFIVKIDMCSIRDIQNESQPVSAYGATTFLDQSTFIQNLTIFSIPDDFHGQSKSWNSKN